MNLHEAAKLLYNHIDVITTIKRGRDFQSEFLRECKISANCDDNSDQNKSHELVYTGYMKAIDPLTKSIILCTIEDNQITNNILILGHNIYNIQLSAVNNNPNNVVPPSEVKQIIETDTSAKIANHSFFYRPENTKISLSKDELIERRDEILDWLKKNRIPVSINKETNEVIIADSVRVRAPYEHESDYICPTRIVLKRIKQIIDSRAKSKQDL